MQKIIISHRLVIATPSMTEALQSHNARFLTRNDRLVLANHLIHTTFAVNPVPFNNVACVEARQILARRVQLGPTLAASWFQPSLKLELKFPISLRMGTTLAE